MIDDTLAAFLQEGVSLYIGTRNDRLEPRGAKASAMRVEEDGVHVVVYVPKVAAAPLLTDLEANGRVAVTLSRPPDERTCQLKGTFVEARPGRPSERAFVTAQFEQYREYLCEIGWPREATDRWVSWPVVAIRFKTTAVFDSTPGPQAGQQVR
jgi:hypothetical protein